MSCIHVRRGLVLAAGVLALSACGDGGGGGVVEPRTGSVQVTLATTGRVLDPDGYTLAVEGQTATTTLAVNGATSRDRLPEGTYTLTLSGVAQNCQVQGPSTATVVVQAGAPAQASFGVACVANRVAYIGSESGIGLTIVTERLDGSDRRRVAGPVAMQRFMWSPDGHRIAYAAPAAGGSQIWVVDVNTGVSKQLTSERLVNAEPSWSPDGASIVFRSQGNTATCDLWVMNADGSNQRALTQSAGSGLCLSLPDWSPDGSRILFMTRGFAGTAVLQWMNPAGTTFGTIQGFAPAGPWGWSPDGSRIVFGNSESQGGDYGFVLRTARPDGTDVRTVGWVPGLMEFGVSWVNPTTVGFNHRVSGGSTVPAEVWTMNLDGTGLARTPIPTGPVYHVRWQ
jgi:hypothetical protein